MNHLLFIQTGNSSSNYSNTTYTNTSAVRVNVMNLKANVGYNLKGRHDLRFSGIYQIKSSTNGLTQISNNNNNGIITLTYNYNF